MLTSNVTANRLIKEISFRWFTDFLLQKSLNWLPTNLRVDVK